MALSPEGKEVLLTQIATLQSELRNLRSKKQGLVNEFNAVKSKRDTMVTRIDDVTDVIAKLEADVQ